jgi:hypothetical protein
VELDDIITLAEAAEELGIAASTLRHQAQVGRLEARNVGKTWITTRQEVERYRAENLGRVGRPRSALPLAGKPGHRPWSEIKRQKSVPVDD